MINYKSLINEKLVFKGFLIPRSKGIDIDTIDDWKLAENLTSKKIKKDIFRRLLS